MLAEMVSNDQLSESLISLLAYYILVLGCDRLKFKPKHWAAHKINIKY